RGIFISICRKILLGQDLETICAKPPMPVGGAFLGWVEDHGEARAIYRSVDNFRSDRKLGKQLGVLPARPSVAQWEEQVRANCERGWPADWIERKYTPPDWNKLFAPIGRPAGVEQRRHRSLHRAAQWLHRDAGAARQDGAHVDQRSG